MKLEVLSMKQLDSLKLKKIVNDNIAQYIKVSVCDVYGIEKTFLIEDRSNIKKTMDLWREMTK